MGAEGSCPPRGPTERGLEWRSLRTHLRIRTDPALIPQEESGGAGKFSGSSACGEVAWPSLRQESNFHSEVAAAPPALLISVVQGSALNEPQRIRTHQALVREVGLKPSAIQLLSKAQLRKAIFTKDDLKEKQSIRSSEHSAPVPGLELPTSQLHTATLLQPHTNVTTGLYFNAMLLALIKKLLQDADIESPLLHLGSTCCWNPVHYINSA